jgi:transketolase
MRKENIKKIVKTCFLNKEGHIASALSILDFLHELYFNKLTDDDKFVLSKGHASLALYSIFLDKGYITEDQFYSFGQKDSLLGGHPSSKKIDKILLSTGSLGHGLPFCIGLAMAKKIKKETGLIYCLIGDGESNEGTTWESALAASTYELDNLICIMDFNKSGERAIKLNSCEDKFFSFGWNSIVVNNGNDPKEINKALDSITKNGKPTFIQLNTIKGYGIPIMENNPEWHHKQPSTQEEYEKIINSIQ